jgi:hypothetical protein
VMHGDHKCREGAQNLDAIELGQGAEKP